MKFITLLKVHTFGIRSGEFFGDDIVGFFYKLNFGCQKKAAETSME